MSVNNPKVRSEFEQSPEIEKWEEEKKYFTADPHFFDFLKQVCELQNIEQIYLSDIDEQYSLRVREIKTPDGSVRHTAALKADKKLVRNGVKRREIPTPISAERFAYYQATDRPRLFKQRAEPFKGVTVDWIENYPFPVIEIEDLDTNEEGQLFLQQYEDVLIDHSGMNDVDNEWIAHHVSNFEPTPEHQLTVEEMTDKVLGYKEYGVSPIVVTVDGRSGSGKSTYARQLGALLKQKGLTVTNMSTDDYHMGKTWLEAYNGGEPWKDWDARIVYDMPAMARDLSELRAGRSIARRTFTFIDQECHEDGIIEPTNVIIAEGIWGGSKDLEGIRHFHASVDTRLATSLGQDLSRLREGDRPNTSIGTESDRLSQVLEFAEPAYRAMDRVSKKSLKAYRHKAGKKVIQIARQKTISL